MAGTVALIAGAVPAIAAATTSSPVTYHACVTSRTGAIKVVSQSATCGTGQHKISWNSVGPRGLTGQRGPAGLVNGYITYVGGGALSPTTSTMATLKLPSGKFLLSAQVWVNQDVSTEDTVTCTLYDGNNNQLNDGISTLTADSLNETMTILSATDNGGTTTLKCADTASAATVTGVAVMATPVANLSITG